MITVYYHYWSTYFSVPKVSFTCIRILNSITFRWMSYCSWHCSNRSTSLVRLKHFSQIVTQNKLSHSCHSRNTSNKNFLSSCVERYAKMCIHCYTSTICCLSLGFIFLCCFLLSIAHNAIKKSFVCQHNSDTIESENDFIVISMLAHVLSCRR